MDTLARRASLLLSGLAPCALCRLQAAGPDGTCSACSARLWHRLEPHVVHREPVPVLALGPFEGPLRTVVHEVKFGGRIRLAVAAGRRLGGAIRQQGWPVARVVPVPLHAARRRERGFNQADGIARGVAGTFRLRPWRGIVRVRATGRQARTARRGRRRNVEGAFVAKRMPSLPVVLVDDVWTTGATARACRAALLEAGAREVRVAVIAHSGKGHHAGRSAASGPLRDE